MSLIAVECIRLLFVNANDTINTTLIDDQLSRMIEITTTIRTSLMISLINGLRWCRNGSMENCLIELEKCSRIESSLRNDFNRPSIIHIYSGELFAFYLLITHRYYFSLRSSYTLNNETISVSDFPSYALRLYTIENQTDPNRIVNTLGIARSYAQIGRTKEANQIYEKLLQDWSDSTFSSSIDRIVIEEATAHLLATKINQIKNNGYIFQFSFILINFLFVVLFAI